MSIYIILVKLVRSQRSAGQVCCFCGYFHAQIRSSDCRNEKLEANVTVIREQSLTYQILQEKESNSARNGALSSSKSYRRAAQFRAELRESEVGNDQRELESDR